MKVWQDIFKADFFIFRAYLPNVLDEREGVRRTMILLDIFHGVRDNKEEKWKDPAVKI